jgi:hypothetical protein
VLSTSGVGGTYGRGEITKEGEALVFRNILSDGTESNVRSVWRRTGPGRFRVERERKDTAGWKEIPLRWITSAFASATLALAATQRGAAADVALARDILRELVAVRTVHPDGDNTAAARWSSGASSPPDSTPADVRVIEPAPLKGNLVARLRGHGGAKPDAPSSPHRRGGGPQGGLVRGPRSLGAHRARRAGSIGRGTLDDKGAAAMFAATMNRAQALGLSARSATSSCALTADEETRHPQRRRLLLKATPRADRRPSSRDQRRRLRRLRTASPRCWACR